MISQREAKKDNILNRATSYRHLHVSPFKSNLGSISRQATPQYSWYSKTTFHFMDSRHDRITPAQASQWMS
jgi:hypothetical protein